SDLTMRDGVSVYANYESTGWTRCTDQGTTLLPQTSAGVVFDASVQSTTALDGAIVNRFAAPTSIGITISGARGAFVRGVTMYGGNGATNLYGIQVSGGALASINFELDDYGGPSPGAIIASGQNVGILAVDSQVTVTGSSVSTTSSQSGTGIGIWLAN